MVRLGSITLTGASGKTYEFGVYNRSATFTAVGAIYVMSTQAPSGRYALIYIGETGDLSKRPLSHHKTACFDKNGADKLLVRAVSDATRRLAEETDLIRGYQPPCNDQ